jgi:hypothetical protein
MFQASQQAIMNEIFKKDQQLETIKESPLEEANQNSDDIEMIDTSAAKKPSA